MVKTMRLDIGLVHHIDPIAITEVVEGGIFGVMGRADRVQVVLLEQLDVAFDQFAAHRPAGSLIVVVQIDPLDQYGHAIDKQLSVAHLYPPEAECATGALLTCRSCQCDDKGIQRGRLGRPLQWSGDRCFQHHLTPPTGVTRAKVVARRKLATQGHCQNWLVVGIVQLRLNPTTPEISSGHADPTLDAEDTIAQRVVEVATGENILNMGCAGRVEEDLTADPGMPPVILILDKTGVRPLQNQCQQFVWLVVA